MRIRPWPTPAAWRCSSVKRPCEVLAGWVMVVFTSPKLAVMLHSNVLSITWKALARALVRALGIELLGLLGYGHVKGGAGAPESPQGPPEYVPGRFDL